MAKPPVTYRWSTDTYYSPQLPGAAGPTDVTNLTRSAPPAGLQAQGWRPADEPGAQQFNAAIGSATDWAHYLDGLFDGADQLSVVDLFHSVEYDHGLHASAFNASAGGGGVFTGSLWTFASAGTITVPLPFLAPNDVITTIEHDYTRGAGNVNFSLFRRSITVGGGTTTIHTDTDSSSSVEVNLSTTYNHTVLAGMMYYATVSFTAPNGSSLYVGALLKASRPHP